MLSLTALLGGCLNQGDQSAFPDGSTAGITSTSTSTKTTASGSGVSFLMTKGVANAATAGTGSGSTTTTAPPNFTLFFDGSNPRKLNEFCLVQSGTTSDPAKSCKCQYTWSETNLSDNSVISRIVQTDPTQITSYQVQCPAPAVYDTEIPDNTIIKIAFVPDTGKGNNSGFSSNILNFTKQPISTTGDFRDIEGRSFRNIMHYVCFDRVTKATTIVHNIKQATAGTSSTPPVSATVANDFSVGTGGSPSTTSAQSYYYDFYIRSNETGQINTGGTGGFTCPLVNIGGVPSPFPLDSQFAVALQTSKDFVVPVTAQSVVATSGSTSTGNVVGYAAKPNSDGSCPSFTDQFGRIRRTFRMRRYKTIYPLRYNVDGNILDQAQASNTIYILDRPVDKVGQDPYKPLTRLGPKPCPFSFKSAQFGQKCMSDASLTGYNIDGTQVDGDPGCPIYPPVPAKYVKTNGTLVIRPYKAFTPYYLEDTQFKACAFQSSTPVDPEIVLSHDDSAFPTVGGITGPKDFYCAKYYPPAGAVIPNPGGSPLDKIPGDCDIGITAASIKSNQTYACSRAYNPTSLSNATPSAGCCQICSGSDCRSSGGGITAAGRNAAFSPPQDAPIINPAVAQKQLPRAIPNQAGAGGCYDPMED